MAHSVERKNGARKPPLQTRLHKHRKRQEHEKDQVEKSLANAPTRLGLAVFPRLAKRSIICLNQLNRTRQLFHPYGPLPRAKSDRAKLSLSRVSLPYLCPKILAFCSITHKQYSGTRPGSSRRRISRPVRPNAGAAFAAGPRLSHALFMLAGVSISRQRLDNHQPRLPG